MMLKIDPANPDTFDANEAEIEMLNAEYMFLTKDLGWKESDINEDKSIESKIDNNKVTKLAEMIFLTEQMGWRKGLKVLGEKGEEAIK